MASMARTPKPPEQLKRRNPASQFVTPMEGAGAAPPYGAGGRRTWSAAQRRWWRALVESGEVDLYEPSDWEVALRAVEVVLPLAIAGDATGLREIRMAESELLMTSKARRAARVDLRPHRRGRAGKALEPIAEPGAPTPIEDIRQRAGGA